MEYGCVVECDDRGEVAEGPVVPDDDSVRVETARWVEGYILSCYRIKGCECEIGNWQLVQNYCDLLACCRGQVSIVDNE